MNRMILQMRKKVNSNLIKNEDQREDQSQQQQQDMAENEKQESQDKQNATAILDALKKNEKINKKQQISRMKKRKLEKDW